MDTAIATASDVFSVPSPWILPVSVMAQIIRFTAESAIKDSEEAPNQNSLTKLMWLPTLLQEKKERKIARVVLAW